MDFSSNDYLGLARDPRMMDRMAGAVLREGCGSTASRLLRGERAAFAAIERRFAEFKGTEAALYFSSGYMANLAVLSTFLEEGDVVFSDALNHASLIDGMRLGRAHKVLFPHCDLTALRRALQEEQSGGQRFLVTESLFSMDGDFAPLAQYADLCRQHGACLVVDEAHAVGVHGARGSGWIEASGVDGDVFVSINSAGKALGVSGAFVAGPAWAIDYLVQRARTFIFSTAPPPSVAAALECAMDLVGQEPERRERALSLASSLRAALRSTGSPMLGEGSQIIPILLADSDRAVAVAGALQDDGFDVRAIRPPTVPEGTARLRVSVHAGLTSDDIDAFTASLLSALRRYPG